jgi:hypothetical protein
MPTEYDALAERLADRSRIGMSDSLADKLKIKTADAFRGELLASGDGKHGPLGVYLLAVYVVDDTDFWSDGEIYWWSIPTVVRKNGDAGWSAAQGLPAGAPPHKCGDLEWMTNVALKSPPLLAVIPPEDDVASCVIRLAVYDDDGAVADFPKAMEAGYEALSACKPEGLKGADNILSPVREAIFKTLRGEQDDIIVEEDLKLAREDGRFGVGFVGAITRSKGRVYYLVKDELHTKTAGPIALAKGQSATLKLDEPVKPGGRIALFARGAQKGTEVTAGILGDLTTNKPFIGDVLDAAKAAAVNAGINVSSKGEASVVMFYTPPG